MTVQVLKCKCSHSFQDKEYGDKMRVHNDNEKMGTECSVCGNIVKTDIKPKVKK